MRRLCLVLACTSSMLSSTAAADTRCFDFESYSPDRPLPPTIRQGSIELSSFPAKPIRIFDPASEGGPQGAKGATMRHRLSFELQSGRATKVKVRYVSFNPAPTRLTITDARGLILRTETLKAKPQLVVLGSSQRNLRSAVSVILDNPSGETVISSVCFVR